MLHYIDEPQGEEKTSRCHQCKEKYELSHVHVQKHTYEGLSLEGSNINISNLKATLKIPLAKLLFRVETSWASYLPK